MELAASLGMSRAPIREALNRLVMAGLATFEPGKGFCGRKLSATELTELYEIRADLEISAIKKSCGVVNNAAIKELRAWWKIQETQYLSMSIHDLIVLDELFHLRASLKIASHVC